MKARVLITALTGLMFLSIGIAQAVPADGVYNGKILKSSECKLQGGDMRACWSLAVRLDSGKVMKVRLWGFGAVIYNSEGKVLYENREEKSGGGLRNKFYPAAASHLKKGVNVRMDEVSCVRSEDDPGYTECEASTIHLK